jgi:hypothetical protein
MAWDDRDKPSSDILDARLRAKYYGTLYIVNRPLLEYALHKVKMDITSDIKKAVLKYRDYPPSVSSSEIEDTQNEMEIFYACIDCIQAAKQSTTAFDGIIFDDKGQPENRLIVTNIFGTAHA